MAERVYCLYRGKDQESILMQKNACHDFAEKKGWNIVGEEQEIGVSGYKVSTDDLVKLKRIRKAAEQGEFDKMDLEILSFNAWKGKRIGRVLPPYITKIQQKCAVNMVREGVAPLPKELFISFED